MALAAGVASAAAASRLAGTSATLEQCITAAQAEDRSATFVGEMTAFGGTARIEMRIDLLERLPKQLLFHAVTAPGLGVWRTAAPGVKVYKYVKQVTNLSAPAAYRGLIHFRWLSSRGRVIRSLALHTAICEQRVPEPADGEVSASGSLSPS